MSDETTMNKYSLVRGAARRARQLQNGAPPMIQSPSMKACRVAQDEIRDGQVRFSLKERRPGAGQDTVKDPAEL